jgi:hypothetical protein
MTRETKIGGIVAAGLVAVLGGVMGYKYYFGEEAEPPAAAAKATPAAKGATAPPNQPVTSKPAAKPSFEISFPLPPSDPAPPPTRAVALNNPNRPTDPPPPLPPSVPPTEVIIRDTAPRAHNPIPPLPPTESSFPLPVATKPATKPFDPPPPIPDVTGFPPAATKPATQTKPAAPPPIPDVTSFPLPPTNPTPAKPTPQEKPVVIDFPPVDPTRPNPPTSPLDIEFRKPTLTTHPVNAIPVEVRPQPIDPPQANPRDAIPVVISRDFTPMNPVTATPTRPIVESFDAVTGHIIRGGDTYARLSELYYRSDRYQQALAELNKERDPRLANPQPGDLVVVPDVKVLETRFPQLVGTTVSAATKPDAVAAPLARTEQPALTGQEKHYRVQPNDTVWIIAKRTLGSGDRWPEILRLNKDALRDVNRLEIGMTLKLPADARLE